MTKHTPGPWEVTKDPYAEAWVIEARQHAHLAHGSTTVARVSAPHGPKHQREANARLIAQAPETAEALEELLEAARGAVRGIDVAVDFLAGGHEKLAAVLERQKAALLDAIARAEDKS